jgi:hypothetical protein
MRRLKSRRDLRTLIMAGPEGVNALNPPSGGL